MIFQQFNLVGRLDVLNNVLMGRLTTRRRWRSLLQALEPRGRGAGAWRRSTSSTSPTSPPSAPTTFPAASSSASPSARALVQEPEIILADEPVASLDPRNAQLVMDALQRINRHFGITVLCNLHSLDLARDLLRPPGRHGGRPGRVRRRRRPH